MVVLSKPDPGDGKLPPVSEESLTPPTTFDVDDEAKHREKGWFLTRVSFHHENAKNPPVGKQHPVIVSLATFFNTVQSVHAKANSFFTTKSNECIDVEKFVGKTWTKDDIENAFHLTTNGRGHYNVAVTLWIYNPNLETFGQFKTTSLFEKFKSAKIYCEYHRTSPNNVQLSNVFWALEEHPDAVHRDVFAKEINKRIAEYADNNMEQVTKWLQSDDLPDDWLPGITAAVTTIRFGRGKNQISTQAVTIVCPTKYRNVIRNIITAIPAEELELKLVPMVYSIREPENYHKLIGCQQQYLANHKLMTLSGISISDMLRFGPILLKQPDISFVHTTPASKKIGAWTLVVPVNKYESVARQVDDEIDAHDFQDKTIPRRPRRIASAAYTLPTSHISFLNTTAQSYQPTPKQKTFKPAPKQNPWNHNNHDNNSIASNSTAQTNTTAMTSTITTESEEFKAYQAEMDKRFRALEDKHDAIVNQVTKLDIKVIGFEKQLNVGFQTVHDKMDTKLADVATNSSLKDTVLQLIDAFNQARADEKLSQVSDLEARVLEDSYTPTKKEPFSKKRVVRRTPAGLPEPQDHDENDRLADELMDWQDQVISSQDSPPRKGPDKQQC